MVHSIGSRLKVWRESVSLKQADAASSIGMSGSTYQNYERDVRAPNTEGWEAFVRAGINANWLLTGEGPMLIADLATAAQVKMLTAERNELAHGLQKTLKKSGANQTPQINVDAMVHAIAAIFQVAPKGESVESLARKAVGFYQYCESQGLITPEGQGPGILKNTA